MACIRRRRGKLVIDYRDGQRRRRWRQFPNSKAGRAAADIALGEIQRARRAGVEIDDRVVVGAFIDDWLKIAAATVSPGTLAHYRIACDHIRARYGYDRLLTLNAAKLLALGTGLLAQGLARSTVATILGTAHLLLAHAVRCGNLPGNPAAGLGRVLKLRRKETADIKAMTEEQLARFLAAARAGREPLALHVYAYTGLRLSEGLGLAVADFDASAGRLRVEHQRLEDGLLHRLKTPASRRSVDVAAPLRAFIMEGLGPRPLLLGNASHHGVQRAFAAARDDAGLPRHFTVHCLRHTFATLHLSRGAPLIWVSRQLGHASVKITADTYGAWIQPESPGTADAFAARVEAAAPGPATIREFARTS